MTWLMSRRTFAKLSAVAGATPLVAGPAEEERLQSELLLRIVLEARPPTTVGDRLIVDVSGGTFEGPRLKGTILGPSGDWIQRRRDGSNVLDVRLLLVTDDTQNIYMSWHGIAHAPVQGGALVARTTPLFETGAPRYAWLNNVVSIGVYQPMPGKIPIACTRFCESVGRAPGRLRELVSSRVEPVDRMHQRAL